MNILIYSEERKETNIYELNIFVSKCSNIFKCPNIPYTLNQTDTNNNYFLDLKRERKGPYSLTIIAIFTCLEIKLHCTVAQLHNPYYLK